MHSATGLSGGVLSAEGRVAKVNQHPAIRKFPGPSDPGCDAVVSEDWLRYSGTFKYATDSGKAATASRDNARSGSGCTRLAQVPGRRQQRANRPPTPKPSSPQNPPSPWFRRRGVDKKGANAGPDPPLDFSDLNNSLFLSRTPIATGQWHGFPAWATP